MKLVTLWIVLVIGIIIQYAESHGILHKILKVSKNATVDELRIEFKKLLRQWYKASRTYSMEAEILHLKIIQAYRELKTQMDLDFHDKHLLSSEYYKSAVRSVDVDVLHSISVPLRTYSSDLLKFSNRSMHLVLFYTVNSSSTHVIHEWFNLLEILTPLGVVMVTINMDNESTETSRKVIDTYPESFPHLILLVDGTAITYDNEFYDFLIMDFIRKNVPNELVQTLDDDSIRKFLNSWHMDNKVRALIYQPSLPLRLHYLLVAYVHRNSVLFGFVNIADENTKEVQRRMNVSRKADTFILFKENPDIPSVKLSMTTIPAKLLNDTISKNSFLTLPRITSQEMFDAICPVSPATTNSLCVILVMKKSTPHVKKVDPKITFRRFIEEYSRHFGQVSFMYVYNEYQPGFILPISDNYSQDVENSPHIVALERIDRNHVKYTLLMTEYSNWEDYEHTKDRLKASIEEVIKEKETVLVDTVRLNDFIKERPPNLMYRIYYRLRSYANNITLEHLLPYIIFIATAIYFVIYFTTHWSKFRQSTVQTKWFDAFLLNMRNVCGIEEEHRYRKAEEYKKQVRCCRRKDMYSPEVYLKNGKYFSSCRELRLHELKAETYNGMVRLLKPGCRTIILMFDRVRADLLVSQFYRAVWPYRKNKNLLFGYVNMEKKATLEWYSELVKACLPEQQEIEINPYFCAGTVLALSGMRKYFCLYHIKHPGIMPSKEKPELTSLSTITKASTYSDDELLKGLREWLDKLFDGSGSVIRYRVNHWPDFKIL